MSKLENMDKSDCGPVIMNVNEHKAGMIGLDKQRINQIIHEASKGSSFHSFQTKRQSRIDTQIDAYIKKLSFMTAQQKLSAMNDVNKLCKHLESKRIMNRIIVHLDMDMFFAAVEIRDNPQYADKPVAVGSMMMISTSNYVARQYGVRAAMAGFVAKQLCPDLLLIKANYDKYCEASNEVMKIISDYDPEFSSFSLDEAYFDLTDYISEKYCEELCDLAHTDCDVLPDIMWNYAYDIVNEIRIKIKQTTQLTASAGISCNTMIAKVCSDKNKPNGQYMVKGNLEEVKVFIENTEARKVSGIGPVRGQFLTALGITTCKDLWDKRDIIQFLFSQFTVNSYMKVALGIGTVSLKYDESRKSMSVERTFASISDVKQLHEKLQNLSNKLADDLKSENCKGKTISIKLKKTTFEIILRSSTLSYYTSDSSVIFETSKLLLDNELSITKPEDAVFRLMGVKMSNLFVNRETKLLKGQLTLSQIFNAIENGNECDNSDINSKNDNNTTKSNECLAEFNNNNEEIEEYECSVCLKKFSHKFLLECHENDCIDKEFNLSAMDEQSSLEPMDDWNSLLKIENEEKNTIINTDKNDKNSVTNKYNYKCPICSTNIMVKSNEELNSHIDICLNKTTCLQLTQVPVQSNVSPSNSLGNKKSSLINNNRKRTRSQKSNSNSNSTKQLKDSFNSSQKTIDFFFRSQSN